MPTVATHYCLDDFTITIIASCDANITIPGSFPIRIQPGSNYFIGFTYITGIPHATGWHINWDIVDDDRGLHPDESSPSVTITPEVPGTTGNVCEVKSGSVRGNVPSPSANRQYNAILTILQA